MAAVSPIPKIVTTTIKEDSSRDEEDYRDDWGKTQTLAQIKRKFLHKMQHKLSALYKSYSLKCYSFKLHNQGINQPPSQKNVRKNKLFECLLDLISVF